MNLVGGCQILDDLFRQKFIDFLVARDGLGFSGLGIVIDVVFAAMAKKLAAGGFQLFHKVTVLHATSSSSSRRMPGIISEENM